MTGASRTRKYRVLTVTLFMGNRVLRWLLRHGIAPHAFALLETVGRRSSRPRQTCVSNGLIDDTFWLVAAHGEQADWYRNICRDPRVRVLLNGNWRSGTAVPLPAHDPASTYRRLPHRWDVALARLIATTPVVVRVDLVPLAEPIQARTARRWA
jgi:deazaflavin-dependent oxidoreductase (nitroreductase family)